MAKDDSAGAPTSGKTTEGSASKNGNYLVCILAGIFSVLLAVFFNSGFMKLDTNPSPSPVAKSLPVPDGKINWKDSPVPGYKFYTDAEVAYNGGKLYLVILGHVFDVSASKSYQPDSGYHGFVGKDGTRAFITGEFTPEGLISDISDLKPADYTGILHWLEFYITTYKFVGYHIGRFYNEDGETQDMKNFKQWLVEADAISKEEGKVQEAFPPCNVEWNDKTGSTFWCSNKSGGISRDWVGFVHQFKESPAKEQRCACVQQERLNDPRVSPYPGCGKQSVRCKIEK